MTYDATSLQKQLILKGFLPAKDATSGLPNDDGVFGTITQAALVKFQEANELTPSGQPDDQTLTRMGLKPQPPAVVKWSLPTFGIPASWQDYLFNFITSKINVVAVLLVVATVGWINTQFGIKVPVEFQNTVTGWIVAGAGALIVLLRTFFNKPQVVAGKTMLTPANDPGAN